MKFWNALTEYLEIDRRKSFKQQTQNNTQY